MIYHLNLCPFIKYFKKPILIAAVIIILVTIYSCSKEKKIRSDSLIVGIDVNPTNLDPRFSLDAASSKAIQVLFNGLVKRDERLELIPDIAEDWEEREGIIYTFHLRKGVLFHNGEELTARDVEYTIKSILDPAVKSPKAGGFSYIKEIYVPDDYTIIFTLKEPFAPFLENMRIGIVPEKYAKKAGNNFSSLPIGTGPFRFKRWINDEKIEFSAHQDYFEGPPKLRHLIYRIIPDETIRLLELEKGNIDLVQNSIPPDYMPRVENNPDFKVQKITGTNFSYLGFNLNDPVLKHIKVRKAVAYAIDREKIIRYILKGSARISSGPLSPMNSFFEGNVNTYSYNPEKAKRLLDEAGFIDPDQDGPKARFSLTYKTSQNELRKLIAEALQEQLAAVGINVEIKNYEWGTFFSDIRSGNFQIYSLTWVGISDPDIFYYIFHSSSAPPNGANRGSYKNKDIDSLLEMGRKVPDFDKRFAIYSKVQKILSEELPYVNLWFSQNIAVMKKNIMGFVVYPDEGFYSIKDVYIN